MSCQDILSAPLPDPPKQLGGDGQSGLVVSWKRPQSLTSAFLDLGFP